MTLGYVTLAMRVWCRRLHKGTRWYRTKEYSFTTYCDRYATPSYGLVERMRDLGLVVFVRGDVTKGHAWEARLTELGEQVGSKRPDLQVRRMMRHGEEDDTTE